MRRLYLAWLTAVAVAAAAAAVWAWHAEEECLDAGGVRMRPLFGTWQCYDAGSLKLVRKDGA